MVASKTLEMRLTEKAIGSFACLRNVIQPLGELNTILDGEIFSGKDRDSPALLDGGKPNVSIVKQFDRFFKKKWGAPGFQVQIHF